VAANGTRELRDRSLAELVARLAEDTSALVRQEVQLAKAEILEKAELMRDDAIRRGRLAGVGSAFFVGAAVMGVTAVGLLATLLVALIDIALPLSAAVAIVLVLFAAVGALLARVGLTQFRAAAASERPGVWNPVPDQTIETIKEDVEWARHPTRSAARSSRPGNG